MLQISIVVFREILEIALVLGILAVATKEIPNRTKWLVGGLAAGILASIVLALSTDKISNSLDGVGQEFFNGVILISAATLIGCTVIWMQKHAKSLSGNLKTLSDSVKEGRKPLYILSLVVFLSVLREGAEIVLFTYSYYIAGMAVGKITIGLLSGTLLGLAVGVALYSGIIKAAGKYFFAVTTWLLVFFAAGIAMHGVGFWVNADLIPAFGDPLFDISNILSQQSVIGTILNMFFGYIDQPTGVQAMSYVATLLILVTGLKIVKKS